MQRRTPFTGEQFPARGPRLVDEGREGEGAVGISGGGVLAALMQQHDDGQGPVRPAWIAVGSPDDHSAAVLARVHGDRGVDGRLCRSRKQKPREEQKMCLEEAGDSPARHGCECAGLALSLCHQLRRWPGPALLSARGARRAACELRPRASLQHAVARCRGGLRRTSSPCLVDLQSCGVRREAVSSRQALAAACPGGGFGWNARPRLAPRTQRHRRRALPRACLRRRGGLPKRLSGQQDTASVPRQRLYSECHIEGTRLRRCHDSVTPRCSD